MGELRFPRYSTALLSVVLLASTMACGSSPTAPTIPPAPVTTQVFSGTVSVGGTDSHPFSVALSNGQLNVFLNAAGPPSTVVMGVGIGTQTDATCTPIPGASATAQAGSAPLLSGALDAGTYCIAVFDVGNQTGDVSYTATVTHY
jgi:hypothetical protein